MLKSLKHLVTPLVLAAMTLPLAMSSASHATDYAAEAAADACIWDNPYQPAYEVTTVGDGLGDYLVWVEDADDDLWACNASSDGTIYFNVMIPRELID